MQTVKQEMEVRPLRGGNDTLGGVETAVSDVRSATSFRVLRDSFQTSRSLETTSRSSRLFSQASRFPIIPLRIVVSQHNSPESPPSANPCINNPPSPRISGLCSILRSDDKKTLGIIFEKADRRFKLSRLLESDLTTKAPSTAKPVPLPEILSAHHQATMELARQRRFALAFHIASALPRTNMSPWLIISWSKHEILLLTGERGIYSRPYLSFWLVQR